MSIDQPEEVPLPFGDVPRPFPRFRGPPRPRPLSGCEGFPKLSPEIKDEISVRFNFKLLH